MLFIDSFTDRALELLKNPIFKGVTTNPTILKRDRNNCGFEKAVEVLSGTGTDNFVQGSLRNDEWIKILKDKISTGKLDPAKLTIKLPWTSSEAAKYVKILKGMGLRVCATAVYSLEQCYTAVMCDVDYVAVYYNRMKNNGIDADKVISEMVKLTSIPESKTRILAASIKEVSTANRLLLAGVSDLTLPLDVAENYLEAVYPENDWEVFENNFSI
jgi:transaldolase